MSTTNTLETLATAIVEAVKSVEVDSYNASLETLYENIKLAGITTADLSMPGDWLETIYSDIATRNVVEQTCLRAPRMPLYKLIHYSFFL